MNSKEINLTSIKQSKKQQSHELSLKSKLKSNESEQDAMGRTLVKKADGKIKSMS